MPLAAEALKLAPVSDPKLLTGFFCGNELVDSFFNDRAFAKHANGLSVIHGLFLADDSVPSPLALAALKGSTLTLSNAQKRKFDSKIFSDNIIPSVTLEFFGVQKDLQGEKLGTIAIEKILNLLNMDKKFGYRLLLVDALKSVQGFYAKNNFTPVDNSNSVSMCTMYIDLARIP